MWFVLGAKGNQWAWQNKQWASVEEFQATQKKWAIWGAALVVGIPVIIVIFIILAAVLGRSNS
jgi:ribose/xylose/arabinose/galactoside ABC-type transport system permease subunit